MGFMDTQTAILLGAVALVALIAIAAWLFLRGRRSDRLQKRFGSEYARTVDVLGSRGKAESELKTREARAQQLTIVALTPSDAARFRQAWIDLQGRFVDNPKAVVAQADQLVRELMVKRGFPVGDFERRAADISVDHAAVVEHYRAAQAIAVRDQRGEASTEELRQAVVHFRALFDELLEVDAVRQQGLPPTEVGAHS